MDELINYYILESSIDLVEIALKRLVDKTTTANFQTILSKVEAHPKATELDVAMYINDIAPSVSPVLEEIIKMRIRTFKDPEAIDELTSALSFY